MPKLKDIVQVKYHLILKIVFITLLNYCFHIELKLFLVGAEYYKTYTKNNIFYVAW